MSSALEISRVSDVLKERVTQSHLTGESGLLSALSELRVPDSFDPLKDIPLIANQLAARTAVNLETIVSAAAIVLSHSTADDVFTGACEISIELDAKRWLRELNLKRQVTLATLVDKGSDGVFADELGSFRSGLGNKSLPNRAELLFRHVPVQQHKKIAPTDPAYFRLSTLKEFDDLRNAIVHGSELPKVSRDRSKEAIFFLHEAAFVAIRSVVSAYKIPLVWDELMKQCGIGNQAAAGGS